MDDYKYGYSKSILAITCENIIMGLVYLKRHLLTNAICIEHISVLLNVIAAVFRMKIFSVVVRFGCGSCKGSHSNTWPH